MNAPADGCCDCLAAVLPFRVRAEPDALVAFYRCPCGHAWFTSWNRDTLEEAS